MYNGNATKHTQRGWCPPARSPGTASSPELLLKASILSTLLHQDILCGDIASGHSEYGPTNHSLPRGHNMETLHNEPTQSEQRASVQGRVRTHMSNHHKNSWYRNSTILSCALRRMVHKHGCKLASHICVYQISHLNVTDLSLAF